MYKRKYTSRIIVITIVSIILFFGTIILFNKKKTLLCINGNDIKIIYTCDGKSQTINAQNIQADDYIHMFVPSFFDLQNITIESLENYEIIDGYYYKNYFSETIVNENQVSPAILVTNNRGNNIIIHQLENDILFIDLEKDYTLDDIKNDKELKVKSNIQNINKYGKIIFNGKLDYIKGRGNASWSEEKKGYTLSFSNNISLENIEETNKYVLIPSFYDMTGMRNKIVYDLADDIRMDYTPNTEYVNIFVNGNYEGLYLLSQHVSVDDIQSKNKNDNLLNVTLQNIKELKEIRYYINDSPSKSKRYLIERETAERYQYNANDAGFITEMDNHYIIHNSENMTFEEIKTIAYKVQELENSLYKIDDKKYLDLIDLESWSKQYLIELISQNCDSYLTSSYFYFDVEENKLYGGPVWDYDNSLGHGSLECKDMTLISNVLSTKKDLMKNVVELFNNLIIPRTNILIYEKTYLLSEQIKKDMYLNALRYNQQDYIVSSCEYKNYDYDEAVSELQGFLFQRINYLDSILNSNDEFVTVRFVTKNWLCSKITFLVKNGGLITDEHEIPYYSNGNGFVWNKPLWISKWLDKDGNEFDFTKPITEDIELYAVWEGDTDASILQK